MATLTKSGGSKSILTITSKLIKVIPINITEIQKKKKKKLDERYMQATITTMVK